jgi:adenosine kinase
MSDSRLVICGSIAIDRIMNFNGSYRELIEPSKLETLSVSVLVDTLQTSQGGVAGNIAHNLAALGDTPVLMGSVGGDATTYIKELGDRGVNTSEVQFSQLATASFNVLTDTQGNQVGGFYPGAMGDAANLSFQPYAGQNVVVCISAHDPEAMRRQVQECKDNGLRLFYDPGQQVTNVPGKDLSAGIEAAEVLIINDYEHGVLLGKTGLSPERLEARVPVLIVTHGEKGSVISGNRVGKAIPIGSAKPGEIADPTGAGDAYRAGFLYGYLRQWDVRKCGQLGAVVASFVLEQHGTQTALDRDAIAHRYKETFNEEISF